MRIRDTVCIIALLVSPHWIANAQSPNSRTVEAPADSSMPRAAISIHQIEHREHMGASSADADRTDASANVGAQRTPLAARSSTLAKSVFGWFPYWISPSALSQLDWTALTTVGHFSLEVDNVGDAANVRGWPVAALRDAAHANGVAYVLTVTSFGNEANNALLGDAAARTRLTKTITDAVVSGGGDGVNIDVEEVPGAQRGNLIAFMEELAASLRSALPAAEISMAIPAVDWSAAFDVQRLGEICDYLIMMGYDYHWRKAPTAGPVAPLAGESLNITRSVQTYLAAGLPPSKLQLGVPWYGYEWPTVSEARGAATTGEGRAIRYEDSRIAAPLNGRVFDEATSTPWYKYFVADNWYQVWYDDSMSLALKYQFVNDTGLRGIGIWALGYQGDAVDVWQGIHQAFDRPSSVVESGGRAPEFVAMDHGEVRFTVETAMHVRLEIYDAIGRRVATLVDGYCEPGRHRASFDQSTLPRGLYLVVSNVSRRAISFIGGD